MVVFYPGGGRCVVYDGLTCVGICFGIVWYIPFLFVPNGVFAFFIVHAFIADIDTVVLIAPIDDLSLFFYLFAF